MEFLSISGLPTSSLVPFDAYKIPYPSYIWERTGSDIDLPKAAYCVSIDGDKANSFDSGNAVTFFAERYGGDGIGCNGGGARCGIREKFQVKGIGRNPLAGSTAPFWHSYGGESVAGGIREVIWAEICNAVLPHGAVRVNGLIDTNSTVPRFGNDKHGATERRGLTVREIALRPAHYIRALGFLRADEKRSCLVGDARRTRDAIHLLIQGFQSSIGMRQLGVSFVELINDYMMLMTRRFCEQHAAARIKRISHGTIASSNISIDGRWLDFGTISSVSDYGRIITAKAGADAQSLTPVMRVVYELWYSISRHLQQSHEKNLVSFEELRKEAIVLYEHEIKKNYLSLLGVPKNQAILLSRETLDEVYACFEGIVASGNSEPFRLFGMSGKPKMPEVMGDYSLNRCLFVIAQCNDYSTLDGHLKQHLSCDYLRFQLINVYFKVTDELRQITPGQKFNKNLEQIKSNSLRVNSSTSEFYRHVLDREIDQILAGDCNIQSFIKEKVTAGISLFSDPIDLYDEKASPFIISSNSLKQQDEITYRSTDFNAHISSVDTSVITFESYFMVYDTPNDALKRWAESAGYISMIQSSSKYHARQLSTNLSRNILSALQQGNAKVYFNCDGTPVAYIVWGYISIECEKRLLKSKSLQLEPIEWNSGSLLWIIDFAAPSGHLKYVLKDLRDNLFKDEKFVRYFRCKSSMIGKEILRDERFSFFKSSPRVL